MILFFVDEARSSSTWWLIAAVPNANFFIFLLCFPFLSFWSSTSSSSIFFWVGMSNNKISNVKCHVVIVVAVTTKRIRISILPFFSLLFYVEIGVTVDCETCSCFFYEWMNESCCFQQKHLLDKLMNEWILLFPTEAPTRQTNSDFTIYYHLSVHHCLQMVSSSLSTTCFTTTAIPSMLKIWPPLEKYFKDENYQKWRRSNNWDCAYFHFSS